ncbi:MAG: SUF system Fe-S cluster assembly regulator [Myxococcota bacterium]|jgi:FeS assembly SUF system regulator|nr:SUF system Fe-S cluster assembly regulator [Myxococcota bacterium]
MFRLSKITDYGIVLLSHMAGSDDRAGDHVIHNARELADHVDLPLPVVSKILKSLAREGVLESHRGARGGYSLKTNAERLTVAQMITVLEGPVAMTECADSAGQCLHEESCAMRSPWQLINHVVKNALEEISLADLIRATDPLAAILSSPIQPDQPARLGDG